MLMGQWCISVVGSSMELDFDDESFDAVTSNYVYHNIPSKDRSSREQAVDYCYCEEIRSGAKIEVSH